MARRASRSGAGPSRKIVAATNSHCRAAVTLT
jgi:hypothetical protein